jgi:hypothetical protein
MRTPHTTAPTLVFTADYHEFERGDLQPGSHLLLRYDPRRLTKQVSPSTNLDHAVFTAHIQTIPGGPVQDVTLHSTSGHHLLENDAFQDDDSGVMLSGMVHLDPHSSSFVLWFSLSVPSGCGFTQTFWDSDYGANYTFRFPSRDITTVDADIITSPPTPYAGFQVVLNAVPAVTAISVRYRVLNSTTPNERSTVALSHNGAAKNGHIPWFVGGIAVRIGAVIAFDIVYQVNGRSYTDDNQNRFFLVPKQAAPITPRLAAKNKAKAR